MVRSGGAAKMDKAGEYYCSGRGGWWVDGAVERWRHWELWGGGRVVAGWVGGGVSSRSTVGSNRVEMMIEMVALGAEVAFLAAGVRAGALNHFPKNDHRFDGA